MDMFDTDIHYLCIFFFKPNDELIHQKHATLLEQQVQQRQANV